MALTTGASNINLIFKVFFRLKIKSEIPHAQNPWQSTTEVLIKIFLLLCYGKLCTAMKSTMPDLEIWKVFCSQKGMELNKVSWEGVS